MIYANSLQFYHFLTGSRNVEMPRIRDVQKRYMVIDQTVKVALQNYKNILSCRV